MGSGVRPGLHLGQVLKPFCASFPIPENGETCRHGAAAATVEGTPIGPRLVPRNPGPGWAVRWRWRVRDRPQPAWGRH